MKRQLLTFTAIALISIALTLGTGVAKAELLYAGCAITLDATSPVYNGPASQAFDDAIKHLKYGIYRSTDMRLLNGKWAYPPANDMSRSAAAQLAQNVCDVEVTKLDEVVSSIPQSLRVPTRVNIYRSVIMMDSSGGLIGTRYIGVLQKNY